MLRKPVTFKDFDGQKVTKDFYFNLTKAELIRLQVSMRGGLAERLQLIGRLDPNEGENSKLILSTFENILKSAYGVRLENGAFVKGEEHWAAFETTEAYSELFMQLVTNAKYAAEFIKGILPEDMELGDVEDLPLTPESEDDVPPESDLPEWIRDRREPTMDEVTKMSQDELLQAFRAKSTGVFPGDD